MSWPRPQPKSRIFSSPFIPSIKPQDPASGGHNSWKLAEDNLKSGGPCFNHSTCFSKPPPFAFNPLSVFLTLHHVFVDPHSDAAILAAIVIGGVVVAVVVVMLWCQGI